MKDKLIKIPLQFFGDPGDPGDDDDFSDDFYNDEADDASVGGEETDPDSNNETGEDNGTGNDSNAADESDDDADVVAELRALGYVGTNLKELAKDMKRKREDNAAQAASAEKKALKSDIKEVEKSIKAHYNALVALTNSYGKNNTQVIKDYCAKNNIDISTYFPAIAWAESLGEGWFVPGIYEAAHYAKYIAWGVGKQSYKGTNKKDITNKYKERNEQLQSHPGYENCNLPTSIRTSSIGSNSMSIYGVKSSWCIDHRLELREEQSEAGIGSLKFSYRSDCYYDIEPYRPMMGMGTWVSYCKVAVCEVDCNAAPEAPVAEANDADAPKAEANDTDAPKTETNDADAPKAETNDTETTSL